MIYYAKYCANVIISGIVISDKTVLKDTKVTEREVSCPNFAENIVVIAATGAQQDITEDTSITPRIEQRYIIPSAISGRITNLNAIARMHFGFFIPFEILLLAKWNPIIIIGMGVFRDAI